jgi:hypothetical protein
MDDDDDDDDDDDYVLRVKAYFMLQIIFFEDKKYQRN